MHFYLPRRHRRKLLFPPGLLALAGLLWLGCLALSGNPRLKRYSVLQLTVPMLHKPSDKDDSRYWFTPQTLDSMRQWQTFRLTGLSFADTIAIRHILRSLSGLHSAADSTGVKIVFGESSKYADFICLLNGAERFRIHKYAFETRVKLPVLYFLSDRPPICSPPNYPPMPF